MNACVFTECANVKPIKSTYGSSSRIDALEYASSRLRHKCQARRVRESSRVVTAKAASGGALEGASFESGPWKWRVERIKSMMIFMVPALVLPLADPLMSIIDTICIGQFADTLALASLGPTALIFSFFSYVFNALGIATTSCVANCLSADDVDRACGIASSALAVAVLCGLVSSAIMQVFGTQVIAATGAAAELQANATAYLRVRAWAQPALLVCIVTQSSLMAQRDSVSPSLAVLLQVVVNSVLDVLLIVHGGFGVVGAAFATVVAQYLGMCLLLLRLRASEQVWYRFGLPSQHDLGQLWATLAPLSVMYVARNLCYFTLQAAAASLAPLQLAAHQAVWSMYTISSFATTTLEQAGLAFLPLAEGKQEARETIKIMLGMGIAAGSTLGGVCWLVATKLPTVFTPDAGVWPFMALVAPICAATMLLVGADVAAAAALISSGRAAYLARSFVITLGVVLVYMYCSGVWGWGLAGVWTGLFVFFATRGVQSFLGLSMLPTWQNS